MTTQQLLALVDDMYANAESATKKIQFMNMAQNELSVYFGTVVEDGTLVTVALQDSYAFPTGISDVSQIESLAIENQATPSSRYDYTKYVLSKSDDNPSVYYSYYQIVNSSGVKKLVIYPVPATSDLNIRIKYHKPLTALSDTVLTQVPDFEAMFHHILALYCCHMICAEGSSPDTVQANMFMQKYNDTYFNMFKFYEEQKKKQQNKARDNRHWHRTKSYGAGY